MKRSDYQRLRDAKRQRRCRRRAGKGLRVFRIVLDEHEVAAMLLSEGQLEDGDALQFATLERALERRLNDLFRLIVTRDCHVSGGSSILQADKPAAQYAAREKQPK